MSEWIRHRGSKSMPKCLSGFDFEVRLRNGEVIKGSKSIDFNHDHTDTDVMEYRIIKQEPAITPPDHSKGFPVGTTAKDIGAKVGDEFVVVDNDHWFFKKGETVTLCRDDGSSAPYFRCRPDEVSHDCAWGSLAPIPPKTAIELQAEEVGIAEPVRLVDEDGWIEWKGGECPVKFGTLVDAKFRNGEVTFHAKAGFWRDDGGSNEHYSPVAWGHNETDYDIIAYRLHQPQEWPEDRMDIVGQNGNDGLHYASKQQAAEADKRIDGAAQGVRETLGVALPTNKYQRTIKGITVDVYDVLAAFDVTCQARGHAIKKLLMAGQRGHKDEAQDLREAVQAIERSIELISK